MKIGIAGCGGIGSNVARNLAQAGVRQMKIVDFDSVEVSNLNRQFYRVSQAGLKKTDCLKENLAAIHPDTKIETIHLKITASNCISIFSDCDIIVEGFDVKENKKMLIEQLSFAGKFMVSASGIAGFDTGSIKVKKIGTCHIVGDFKSDQDRFDLYPPKIMIVASMMADIVLQECRNKG